MNKFKNCRICGLFKSMREFNKKSDSRDGYRNDCKECRKKYRIENREIIIKKKLKYYKENRNTILKKSSIYRKINKLQISKLRKIRHKKQPWKKTFSHIKQRCNNKKCEFYKYYGGRGITCLITEEEIKQLWFRDKAYLLKKPSIDRKDNNGNYTFDNCQFIERVENTAKAQRKVLLQYDLNNKFIKKWTSATEASRFFKVSSDAIMNCARGLSKTSCGYVWKYEKLY